MKVKDSTTIDSGYDVFNSLEFLNQNLAYAATCALARDTKKEYIYDFSLNRHLDRGTTLAVALALKGYIQKNFPDCPRIGIALPACFPGVAVNLAVQMAGKSSVNINFTTGSDSAKASLAKAGITCIIGSKKVREKVSAHAPDFPWTDNFVDIGDILKSIGKKGILPHLIAARTLPGKMICALYGIPKTGGDKEASIIFTSGSESAPKAAVLTHKNLMANARQMSEIGIVDSSDSLHANLPLFHSFGQSVQLWFTMIFGVRVVMVQSPLEVQTNLEAARKGGSTIMISTPTFLRAYYKKATSADFPKLKNVIGGAEKTPDGFIEAWNAKFPHVAYLEGYGLTEASPVVSVNLPSNLNRGKLCPQPSATKAASVGEIFPGMQARVADPDTGAIRPVGEVGLLQLKGANIFGGYLNQPEENKKKLSDGWLNTGDLAMLDSDGFIFIKGRLSRFSKIGGEMVPHSGVEEAIVRVLGLQESELPLVAIGSKIDPAKGEALVLLAAVDIDIPQLRRLLTEAGLPNLWIPKYVMRVDAIPLLGTGKLDLGTIHKICKSAG